MSRTARPLIALVFFAGAFLVIKLRLYEVVSGPWWWSFGQ
jgi:hypothetical protein